MTSRFWTEAEDETLRRMLAEGAAYSQIGKALDGRTKSQVCGRVRRLGLADPKNNPIRPGALTNAKRHRPAKASRPAVQAPPAPEIKVKRGKCPGNNRMTPAAHPSTRAPRPSDNIWRPTTCQFPVGDPKASDFHFCGETIPTPDGRPYCDACHARCYTARPQKAPGEGGIQSFKQNGWGYAA